MQDRVPLYPGRVKLTPVSGKENTYDMVRADEPTQEGTPLSKATFLNDTTAEMFGLGSDSVPDDALSKLSAASIIKKVPRYTQTTIGGLKVGSIVKLNVNGAAKEFVVVHHGKPSSLYDDSCNGTWLMMKDIYESRQWYSSNSYKDSDIHTYLNGTFLNMFDADIKAQIKTVKIPYVNGTGNSAVASGANGLPAQIFLLSGYEVGFTNSNNQYFPSDGAKLDYFVIGNDSYARNKRIAKMNENAAIWWLRSPNTNFTTSAWQVLENGDYSYNNCTFSYGIRPALVLPYTFGIYYVDSDGNTHTEQEYCDTLTDILGSPLSIPNSQIIGSAKISYGSYVGTGTSGENNPTSLTFDFEPKLLLLIDRSGNDLPSILLKGGSKLFHFISDPNNAALWNYSFDGNSVSWYYTGTSWQHINGYFSQTPAGYHQSNKENQVYYYLAIG